MTSEDLFNFVMNDKKFSDSIDDVHWMLNRIMNRAAERLAKQNQEWHDNPEKEDHKEYQAHANEQFPQSVRNEAAIDLIKYRQTEAMSNKSS